MSETEQPVEVKVIKRRDDAAIIARLARTQSCLVDADLTYVADVDLIVRDVDEYLLIAEFRQRKIRAAKEKASRRLSPDESPIGAAVAKPPSYT